MVDVKVKGQAKNALGLTGVFEKESDNNFSLPLPWQLKICARKIPQTAVVVRKSICLEYKIIFLSLLSVQLLTYDEHLCSCLEF